MNFSAGFTPNMTIKPIDLSGLGTQVQKETKNMDWKKAEQVKPEATSRAELKGGIQNVQSQAKELLGAQVAAPSVAGVQNIQGVRTNAANIRTPEELALLRQAVNQAQAAQAQAGQVDINPFLQALSQSAQSTPQALAMAQAAAQGQGPSAAQAQLQSGVDQAIAAQMAAAQSGGGGAAALRGAQQQAGLMQQQAANQAAQLRAAEQAQAMGLFADLAGQADAQRAAIAAQGAGLSLGAQELAGAQQQAALNAYLSGAGQLAGIGAELATQRAGLQQQANLANQEAQMRAALANQQAGLAQSELGLQSQLAAMNAQTQRMGLGAGLLGQGLGAQQAVLGSDIDLLLGEKGLASQRRGQDIAKAQADRDFLGTIIGGGLEAGGGVLASLLSDENAKTDIKPNDSTKEFLAALTDNEYRYKNPKLKGAAKGKQYGPMAQDLAKTKMGKTAVVDMGGYMGVDPGRAVLLALSGLSNLNARLSKLEAN